MAGEIPDLAYNVIFALRRLQFELGIDEILILRNAVRAGHGLQSDREFIELCVALWATSDEDALAIRAVCARYVPSWNLDSVATRPSGDASPPGTVRGLQPLEIDSSIPLVESMPPARTELTPVQAPIAKRNLLPPLPALTSAGTRILFAPQYPLTRRAIAQAFRRLRRSAPAGPKVQLDIGATIELRYRSGVPVPPVLVPRRRNIARLLLMIDRQGSMAPFHAYSDYIRTAIVEDGGLGAVDVVWFHDIPVDILEGPLIRRLSRLSPELDPVLPLLRSSLHGLVYADAEMTKPRLTSNVVKDNTDSDVIILSDAGAARGSIDVARNLATVAFARALREQGRRVVWLNPMPRADWAGSSAALLARHVPMLPLNPAGLNRAVDVLRGRPMLLERAA